MKSMSRAILNLVKIKTLFADLYNLSGHNTDYGLIRSTDRYNEIGRNNITIHIESSQRKITGQ